MSHGKPITITLFHADSCGHCTTFMPIWNEMKADKDASKNIDFMDYESAAIGDLPEDEKTVDGEDIREYGYPAIKITVNNKSHAYLGRRSPQLIYKDILDHIKNPDGNENNDESDKTDKTDKINDMDTMNSIKRPNMLLGGNTPKIFSRKITDDDFKFMNEITHFSEVAKIK